MSNGPNRSERHRYERLGQAGYEEHDTGLKHLEEIRKGTDNSGDGNETKAETQPDTLRVNSTKANPSQWEEQLLVGHENDGLFGAPRSKLSNERTNELARVVGTSTSPSPQRSEKPPTPYYQLEMPSLKHVLLLALCCIALVPVMTVLTRISRGLTLFAVRMYVAVGTSIGGVLLGFVLGEMAKRYMWVLTWATVIHQARAEDKDRMTLRELNDLTEDAASIMGALRLFYIRRRTSRKSKEMLEHNWSIYIVPFVFLVALSSSLSFLFGRGVDIVARQSFDPDVFNTDVISGDLSRVDVESYPGLDYWTQGPPDSGPFQNYDPNYLPLPNPWENDLPSYISFTAQVPRVNSSEGTNSGAAMVNTTVYFAEAYLAQLLNFTAVGAASSVMKDAALRKGAALGRWWRYEWWRNTSESSDNEIQPVLVQHAKWGARTICERIPDLQTNMNITDSSLSLKISRLFAQSLFNTLELAYPSDDSGWSRTLLYARPLDSLSVSSGGGTNVLDVSFSINDEQRSPPGRHLAGFLLDDGSSGSGWLTFDVFIFRILTSLAPHTSASIFTTPAFPVVRNLSSTNAFFPSVPVGHDAMACLQVIEPWIVEVANTGRAVSMSGVVQRGGDVSSVGVGKKRDKLKGPRVKLEGKSSVSILRSDGPDSEGTNGQGKNAVFRAVSVAAANDWWAVCEFRTTSGATSIPDCSDYQSCGTLTNITRTDVSLTYGTGPTGFTSILSKRYTTFRGVTTSLSVLPLLAGSAPLLVRSFVGITLATARVTLLFYMSLISIFMLGFATIVYVPKMPRGMPGRGFGCYSWAAVFLGDGLILERPETKDHQSEQKGSNDMENRVETEPLLGPKRQEIKDLGLVGAMETVEIDDMYGDLMLRYPREGVGIPEKELDYYNVLTW